MSRSLDATDLARVAVFAALIAVLGLPGGFVVFGGVPVTLQTLGVMLAGAILGPWLGAMSVTVLLALAAIGLPVMSGGRGGFGIFLGPTAGYAIGWILGAVVIGLLVHAGGRRPVVWRTLLAMIVGGIGAIYLLGIPVQSLVMRMPLGETILSSAGFLPGDLAKAVIATIVVTTLVRAYPRGFRRSWRESATTERAPEAAAV